KKPTLAASSIDKPHFRRFPAPPFLFLLIQECYIVLLQPFPKLIKRIAFGYRNFYNFRARIYLQQGLIFEN
ncbi:MULTISPECIES: hypothetical protein, partial [Enterococcus]|uniref:hypothetical protein n=1 Tax=Enterococcus TaxID=1350 RepID=UPI002414632E